MSTLDVADATTAASRETLRDRAVELQKRFPVVQLLVLLAVFAYGAISLPGLTSWSSIKEILVLASLVGLASAGQTLLILLGGFDLSISGFIVASGLVVTTLDSQYHWSFLVAILIAFVGMALLGAFAGYVCHRFQIQPLIVTLATGSIAVGLVQAQTGGTLSGSAPPWLTRLASPLSDTFGVGLPPMLVIWLVVTVLMGLFLHRTVPGRQVLATGANPRAAEYSLIRTRRVWTLAFMFSAIASVFVGLLIAGFAGSIDDTVGDPYLFESVVAVIVGGTVFGGPGDYTRTVVGALFVTVVMIVLVGHGASQATEQIIYGLAILVALASYGRRRRLRDSI